MRLASTLTALAALSLAAISANAATFTNGEFVTHNPVQYGTLSDFIADPPVAALVEDNFNTVLAPVTGYLEVGIPGPAGFSMIFDSPDAIIAYLPSGGTPGPLTADLDDPLTSASGTAGAEVVTTTLNVDLSYAGVLAHPAGVAFGDLVFQNLGSTLDDPFLRGEPIGPEIAELNGVPVHEALSEANLYLGGAASPLTGYDWITLLMIANQSFTDGNVSAFAGYLALPPSTTPVPEPPAWTMLLVGLAGLGVAARSPVRPSAEIAAARQAGLAMTR